MANTLILVRHSQSQPDPSQPASQWGLTEQGRRRCAALADRLALHAPSVLVNSAEPKALETAAIVAGRLGLACEIAADLHEHLRERVGWLALEQFDQAVAALFERPDELALGEETANRGGALRTRPLSRPNCRDSEPRHRDHTVYCQIQPDRSNPFLEKPTHACVCRALAARFPAP